MWAAQQQLLRPSANISAFGEDETGELYAVGYSDGTIYKVAARDSDGDGLPDWWEMAYFGSTTGAVAGADADSDGANNLSEYLYGTDPLNPQSAPGSPPVPPVVAVFRPGAPQFFIDVDAITSQISSSISAPGDFPLVGRIDNDRKYDIVVYRGGLWYVDVNRDGIADRVFGFGGGRTTSRCSPISTATAGTTSSSIAAASGSSARRKPAPQRLSTASAAARTTSRWRATSTATASPTS